MGEDKTGKAEAGKAEAGRVKTIARRSFLIGSAASVGGVAFGVWRYKTPYANPLEGGLRAGEAALTPYVKIDREGVTLITPRADKGQGAYHVQAALIAEELDVDLAAVRIDPGPPDRAYWNTALAPEAAEFSAPQEGFMREAVTGVLGSVMKFAGMQITGGSTTVPDGFVKLRAAGASARETLKLAAAGRLGVAVEHLRTEAGRVIAPDGRAIGYEDLAEAAAALDPVQDVALRAPEDWRYLGQPMQRLDVLAKSTGTQAYGIDFEIEGMVHAAVRLAPAQGGGLQSYDASAALAMRGVRGAYPVSGGVAVVADNTWRAFQAAEAIEARWHASAMPARMEDHWAALEAAFGTEQQDSRVRDDGDVEAALAQGVAVTARYRAPYLAHAPLEPVSACVRVTQERVDVWTGTQIPRFVQASVARIAGVARAAVHVHVLMMGGSFGHRLEDDVVRQAAEVAVQMPGVPVKLTYSRETDMAHDYTRQIAMAKMRGTVKEGRVEAYDLSIAMPSVIVSQMGRQGLSVPGPDSQIVAGAFEQPFAIPHHRVTGYRAEPLAPISSWRSVGASTNGFFYNLGLDELIEAAGADPLEERLRLASDPLARKVLEAVGEMSGWNGAGLGPRRGRGIALTRSFGVQCAEVVEVTDTDEGIRIDKVYVAAEVGRVLDPVTFENQVQGGVIWGLGHAMNCEITYEGGVAEQQNFDSFEGMRLSQCPEIVVRGLENAEAVRGVGEPPVPPAAPALAGAIYAATGVRLREMPFSKFVAFAG
ncbi:molybdopterin cofactor-binding domain-containing protein [uncultured Lentibacter sp.]|uniref:xanthine dehydrogenase family protein molybdopterin-binding subunit n=1 Tax=uncultured Lentibacter sp. TaxID=1659309 RepID=UPI00261FC140|nr:molybdopterin cofactor-binding domain-containing protein [uncultured Lentibacter sp.]